MINPQDIANLAKQLQDDKQYSDEVHYRNVVGRWYYGAFSGVKKWLEMQFAQDLKNAQGATHERLRDCCYSLQRQKMDLSFSRLGRLLNELHQRRVKADYYLDHTVIKEDMLEAQLKYDDIVQLLDELKTKYNEIE